MSPELDKQLCENYPKLFVNRHADMSTTAMCWGFDCGDGWYNIINILCRNIQSHIDHINQSRDVLLKYNPYSIPIPDEVPQVIVTQVKEKYGTLRFYYNGGDSTIDGLVSMAESISGVTCEVCGDSGKPTESGWIRVLCNKHQND